MLLPVSQAHPAAGVVDEHRYREVAAFASGCEDAQVRLDRRRGQQLRLGVGRVLRSTDASEQLRKDPRRRSGCHCQSSL